MLATYKLRVDDLCNTGYSPFYLNWVIYNFNPECCYDGDLCFITTTAENLEKITNHFEKNGRKYEVLNF